MLISRDDLMAICPRPKGEAERRIWDGYAAAMLSREGQLLFARYEVNTPARMAMFMGAVVAPETGMRVLRESGRYSAEGILRIFGAGRHSSAITPAEARAIAALPVNPDGSGPRCDALFERAYGLKIAHCCKRPLHCATPKRICKAREFKNYEPGDGARCRGLGLNQMTGREPQEEAADTIGCTLDELATPLNCVHMALIEWDEKNLNKWADIGGEQGVVAVRKLVNAGSLRVPVSRVNGIPEAMRAYSVARRVITHDDAIAAHTPETTGDEVWTTTTAPAENPPPRFAFSSEAQLSGGTAGSGVVLVGKAAQASVMTVAKGGSISVMAVVVEMLSREEFWIGAGIVFAGLYFLYKRFGRFYVRGI